MKAYMDTIRSKANQLTVALMLMIGLVGILSPVAAAGTTDCTASGVNITTGNDCARGDNVRGSLFTGNNSLFKTVTNVLLFLIGAVSVIMLIIGGLRYVLSNGDSGQITNAKNTILYAVIGIVVALLAYAIVNFVITSFANTSNS